MPSEMTLTGRREEEELGVPDSLPQGCLGRGHGRRVPLLSELVLQRVLPGLSPRFHSSPCGVPPLLTHTL